MTLKQRVNAFMGKEKRHSVGFYEWFMNDPQYCIEGYRRLSEVPEVMTCINAIASLVSSMTIHLMKNTEKGDIREINNLSKKIDIHPYKNMIRQNWVEWIVKTMLIEGNAFVYPIMKDDYIEDLMPVPNKKIILEHQGIDYKIRMGDRVYSNDDFLHFAYNVDPDDPQIGKGLRVELKDILKTLKGASDIRTGFMQSDFRPSVIIYVNGITDEIKDEEGRENIRRKIGAKLKPGEPFIVEDELARIEQVKPLTLNDLAIADGLELDKRQVAALFGVPSYYMGLGEFDKDEHNNFVKTTIRRIAGIICQTLTRGLILSPDRYFKMNPRSLLSFSIEEISKMGKELGSIGFIVGNEIRDDLGLAPLAGLDRPIVLENYIPVDKIGDQSKLE